MPTRFLSSGFSGGVISGQIWGRVDLEKYALSLSRADNCLISKPGSVLNRAGTYFIGEVRDSSKHTRLTPFQFSTEQSYVQEWGNLIMRPIKSDGQILEAAKNVVSITRASPGVVTITAHGYSNGDKVFPASIGGMTELLDGRTFTVANRTTDTFTLVDLWGNAVDTSAYTAYTSGGTFARLYQLTTPYADTDVFDLGYDQTADTMLLAHLDFAPRSLTRSGHANWSIGAITFAPSQVAPTSPNAAATVGSGATSYSYVITSIDEDTGEESLPSSVATVTNDLTTSGNYNTVSWVAASGAERYIIYKADNGVYGLIGGTTGTSFIDDNILPDLGDTPPAARNPFGATDDYPAVVTFHEGRSVWAHTNNTPSGIWFSASNLYYNMNVSSPAKADDAVTLELRPGVNAVQGISSARRLLVFTADAEYTIEGGGVTEAITPSSIVVKRHTARGSKPLRPIVIGDIVLHAQRQGSIIRAMGYSFEKDGYRTNDLTLLAPHFFRGYTIVDWCYQQDPDSIVYCVRSDGAILALTFVEDQNTFAWTILYLGGSFGSTAYGIAESCCAIEGDDQDDVYFVVKRTINSQTKRYIEKLMPRWVGTYDADGEINNITDAYFVDCGYSYSGTSTSTITNLWHLEGQSVTVLANGDVQGPFTVASGKITLTSAATVAHVGLSYTSEVNDLPLAQQTQTGAAQGRLKGISDLVFKLHQTRGISFGGLEDDDARLAELKQRATQSAWDDPIQPYTGDTMPQNIDARWSLNGQVRVLQTQPLPFELLAIAKTAVLGGP